MAAATAGEGCAAPHHVDLLSYDVEDVRLYFARAALLVTDYSSRAFNAAYIDRPVVYFQLMTTARSVEIVSLT